jgi:hypothetical protein
MLRSVTSTEGTTRQGGSCSRCSVVRWRCAGRLRVTAVELAARGRRLRAAHERVVCRLVVCQPDFTQELPRKLLPTRAKEAQRRRREKHSFTRLSLWRLGSRVDLKRAHNPKVVGSNPTPATMNDEGLADIEAANPFRLPRLHPDFGAVALATAAVVREGASR